jgi:hypothetical protein
MAGFDEPSKPIEASKICAKWVRAFQQQLKAKDVAGITDLFAEDGFWRDLLILEQDFNTLASAYGECAQES